MKHILKLHCIFILFTALLISACNPPSSRINDPDFIKRLKDPSVKDINQSIQLRVDPANPGQLKSGGIINLIVSNQSKKPILFSPSFNVQIFLSPPEKNQWDEITNNIRYHGEDMVIDPKGTGLDIGPFPIRPEFTSNGKEQQLRVAVTGYVVKDGKTTDEAVSAFIDITFKP